MQEVIRIEPRASAPWSVLAQCYEDMNESQKALQLRIMAAHLRHDAEEWDRLAQESKYEFLKHSYLRLKDNFFLGNMVTISKLCIVTERFTVSIHPMSTPYGIEHLLLKRSGIFEPSVHICAICNPSHLTYHRLETRFLPCSNDFLMTSRFFENFIPS